MDYSNLKFNVVLFHGGVAEIPRHENHSKISASLRHDSCETPRGHLHPSSYSITNQHKTTSYSPKTASKSHIRNSPRAALHHFIKQTPLHFFYSQEKLTSDLITNQRIILITKPHAELRKKIHSAI